ncbi:restriction endonuclease subunit S [Segatella copri]|uniref:Type I restriction modification DNA specificity domain protein n=1 Tax=Segatella copri DSM 18205 TaxID=537011 RepID=D1PEN4_9BACT|nr:restriction endonuclease subunit S [Segatella copri]EFB34826.1 type I restriction modification DNA specificity domain protein [Segatella copri DSM 18205]UEA43916.1 restriction endonuclease subunit S [Segatella copri DSM 18205]
MWCKLEDITSVIGDGLHGTPQYNPNGAYYFVNGNNLSNRQIIIKNNTKRVSEEEYIKYKKPLNEHTILVSINGTIGNIGTYSNEQIILGKSACYFNITPFLVKEYMCYVIESNYFQKYALLSATGSTIKNVPLKAINEFYVPIPPVSEQKRIVSEIDYLLAFINKVEEGRENLQSIVQSAKSKILDLAIHGKLVPQDPNEEPASELLKRINPKAEITCDTPQYGKLLKGWCETTLKSLAKEVFAGGDKPTEFTKEKTNGNIIPIYSNGVEKDGLYGYTNVARVIEPCLTVSARGTIGFTCIRNIPFVPIVRLITIVPNPAFDLKYMKFCLDCLLIWSEGSSIPQLTVPTIKKMQLPLPPLQEQHRIVAKIEELFNQLNKIEESVL